METLVLHSVKGGVGRSLVLCNLSVALAQAGYKVLMLDFDYTAPGLHRKFGMEHHTGYIEYLRDVSLEKRCQGAKGQHWGNLEEKIRPVPDVPNLYLLGAGNETLKAYWEFLASYRFHRLFYFTRPEISGLSPTTFPKGDIERNRLAFEGDLALIRDHFQPDYLLVDCKTAYEANAFILLLWADRIAHLFPPNPEGCFYALQVARSVARFHVREKNRPILFLPVVARAPDDFEEDGLNKLKATLQKEWASYKDVADEPLFADQNFVFLSELRNLEAEERILAQSTNPDDRLWELSHDQLDLFARLAPPNGSPHSLDDWYSMRNMDKTDRLFLKAFKHRPHWGTMLNLEDNQPNIAFRVRTLHLLFDSLLKAFGTATLPTGTLYDALCKTGYAAGKDFASELKAVLDKLPGLDMLGRLTKWAHFDSGVGFGHIDIDVNNFIVEPISGLIHVTGDAFSKAGENDKQDLRGIFVGYVQAVIETLAETGKDGIEVIPVAPTSSSTLPNRSIYKFKSKHE